MAADRDARADELARELQVDYDLRREAARVIVRGAPESTLTDPLDRAAMMSLLAAASGQVPAAGECHMDTPAGRLRPVLRPDPDDSSRTALYWCCTGHNVEHCSRQVDR